MRKTFIILSICIIASMISCAQSKNPLTYDEGVVINGVKWATRNVNTPGTFAENSESSGMFYQWNRKIGWSATTPLVNSDGGTVWDNTNPEGENWIAENDPSPKGWRVPTLEEVEKLLDKNLVTREWTTQNGMNGVKFTDKNTGKSIFFPAAGCLNKFCETGSYGEYWIRETWSENYADVLYFVEGGAGWDNTNKINGTSVRSVAVLLIDK